jgi:hypothetical protein
MDESMDLFEFLRISSEQYWRASCVSESEKPPEFIWRRRDIVPIGMFGWFDSLWTCLKSDGTLVNCEEGREDRDFPRLAHNPAVGLLMQQIPAASAYLRPCSKLVVCGACRGTGRLRDEVCVCGGLGWLDVMRDVSSDSAG